jgi:diadenosine tetraphosphatase ApaH/serine/threonine PP2A family protein phosphatase
MQVAALYDVHGNLPALDAVLADVVRCGAERIVFGGDIVPGPMPRETFQRLRTLEMPSDFIIGNGELAVLAEADGKESGVPAQFREGIRWNAAQLQPTDCILLSRWPTTLRLHIEGIGSVLFCHATPGNPHDIFTRATPEDSVLSLIGEVDADLVVCGHTHMQFDRRIGRIRVVNAGSVGMPFGQPGAYWTLLGPEVQLRRTLYDFEEAASQIRMTSYPDAEAFAARNILQPPSEEKMLRAFNQT